MVISKYIKLSMFCLWIYKKNNLLYLSYHKREWLGARKLPENVKKTMINNGHKVREYYPVSFRHELIVTKMIQQKQNFDKFYVFV